MTPRQRRLAFVVLLVAGVATAAALALSAFQENLVYFFAPTQVVAGEAPIDYPFRMGGLVAEGSIRKPEQGLAIRFVVTDGAAAVPVVYEGVLPDLFREGQGVVVRGRLGPDSVFVAEEVLAKHDENYMPPNVAETLKRGVGGEASR